MRNHYETLGVTPESTPVQIKKAFRRKAKAFHPDVSQSAKNEQLMRVLIIAYEVLSDPARRQQYDRLNARNIHNYSFDYREFLKERDFDDKSIGKLIFFDLLHNYEDEALALYDRLIEAGKFQLKQNLEREDYMDCAFLLAEEYERHGNYVRAFELLKNIVVCELENPYFRHFFREVVDRLRLLSCFRMPGIVGNRKLIDYLKELVEFNFSPKDTAFFLKKIAELYADENATDQAQFYLGLGLQLHGKLPGVKKLKEKLASSSAGGANPIHP